MNPTIANSAHTSMEIDAAMPSKKRKSPVDGPTQNQFQDQLEPSTKKIKALVSPQLFLLAEMWHEVLEVLDLRAWKNMRVVSKPLKNAVDVFFKCKANKGYALIELEFKTERAVNFACDFKLQRVNLSEYISLTDNALERIAELSDLAVLNLAKCTNLTDEGLRHISHLSKLQELNLAHWANLTDEGLRHISNLSNLQKLSVSWCKNITDIGIKHVAGLPGLKEIAFGQDGTLCKSLLTGMKMGTDTITLNKLGFSWRRNGVCMYAVGYWPYE